MRPADRPAPLRLAAAPSLVRAAPTRDPGQSCGDLFEPMPGGDGRPRPEPYLSDGLHMMPAGHAVWRERLLPAVRR